MFVLPTPASTKREIFALRRAELRRLAIKSYWAASTPKEAKMAVNDLDLIAVGVAFPASGPPF